MIPDPEAILREAVEELTKMIDDRDRLILWLSRSYVLRVEQGPHCVETIYQDPDFGPEHDWYGFELPENARLRATWHEVVTPSRALDDGAGETSEPEEIPPAHEEGR